jgi:hypothetical protein
MRSAILAFVMRVWCLQQMPQLPDWYWAILLPLMLLPFWLLPRRLQPGKKLFLLIFCAGPATQRHKPAGWPGNYPR